MQDFFVVHYCSVCYVCKKLAETLKNMRFCSGCRLVQYCSVEHQKLDWPHHKDLCKAVQCYTKERGLTHVYEDAKLVPPENNREWFERKMKVLNFVVTTVNRPFTTVEMQMILSPPVCSYCHIYKPGQMCVCNKCKNVMYCCEEHQGKDEKHQMVCKSLWRSFQVNMFRVGSGYDIFNFIQYFDLLERPVREFPENMESLIEFYSTSIGKGSCLSEMLSYSMTIVYLMTKVAKPNANSLTLHIVGADTLDMLAIQTLPLVYHLLPFIIHLNVVLIGPTLVDRDSPELMVIKNVNIKLSYVKALYHDYVVSSKFVAPDVIAAFNCGFCESENPDNSWERSLPCILSFENTVVIITSRTELQSLADTEKLYSLRSMDKDICLIMESKQNPFRSLYPHRDHESEGVYYVNSHVSVMKT